MNEPIILKYPKNLFIKREVIAQKKKYFKLEWEYSSDKKNHYLKLRVEE